MGCVCTKLLPNEEHPDHNTYRISHPIGGHLWGPRPSSAYRVEVDVRVPTSRSRRRNRRRRRRRPPGRHASRRRHHSHARHQPPPHDSPEPNIAAPSKTVDDPSPASNNIAVETPPEVVQGIKSSTGITHRRMANGTLPTSPTALAYSINGEPLSSHADAGHGPSPSPPRVHLYLFSPSHRIRAHVRQSSQRHRDDGGRAEEMALAAPQWRIRAVTSSTSSS
ncbi:hypothetical protein RJ55_05552 [Drechmeria coniospora]|nr:hypothetical protein RJ55_05552 [Drechmeria coniospora]